MALSVGSVLAGRYVITAPIATGGMGEVWQARDQVLDRIVAAKVLKSEYTGDPSFLARFRNEARHTAALTHPNIASVYDYGETVDDTGSQKLAFLVMEYVEGQPLVTILHEEGRLPVDWTLHVLIQSADGLSAAHRAGVVHRDIKPGNLMVRPDGVVKLTDFGIAQARDAAPLTRTGMVVGTAQYLSPEQAQGMEVTAASDVYSLGVVAFECLAGARPFDGASQVAIALAHINRPPPPLPGDIPPAVRLLVDRALAKNPSDRFPDGGAFAEALRRVATGGSVTRGSAAAAAAAGVLAPPTAATEIVEVSDGRTELFSSPTTGGRPLSGAPAYPPTGPARPMPPLQAPDEDDDSPDGGGYAGSYGRGAEDDGPRRRPRWLWLVAALLVLGLLGGGTWLALSGNGAKDPTTGGPTTSAAVSSPGAAFNLVGRNYIGRDADEAAAELEQAGLVVVREPADEDQLAAAGQDLAANDVAAVAPGDGPLPAGSRVTLYVAEEGYTVEQDGGGEDEGDGGGNEEPSTTPTPTREETSAPPTTSEAPASTTAESSEAEPPPSSTPPPTTPTTAAGSSPSASPTDDAAATSSPVVNQGQPATPRATGTGSAAAR